MKIAGCLAFLLAFAGLAGAAAPPTVSPAEIQAENLRWTSEGVKLPSGGIVLAHPYASPYSNRSFVVPYAWYDRFSKVLRARHNDPVDAAALRADLPTLRLLMQKTYAGYGTAAARGWNWNAWFARWDASLAARGSATLTLAQAFAPWGNLEAFQLDNHSGVPGFTAFTSGSASATLASRPKGACTSLRASNGRAFALAAHDAGQQPHATRAWNGSALAPAWYVAYPQRDGTATAIRCGGRAIAVHVVHATPALPQTPSYESVGDRIAYVRMPTFSDANNAALYTALSKAQGLGSERVVLLDLRGNQGGNAPTDVLSDWVAQSQIEIAGNVTQYSTQSCFRTALSFGLQQQLAAGLKPPAAPQVTTFLQQIVDALAAPSDCSVQPDDKQSDTDLRDHHFAVGGGDGGQPRLVAIVDSGCGSDCEYMVDVIAGLPGTVIVGSSTYGVMGFSQPGYFVLPHSRVPFRLALSRTDAYGDGRSVDGYGINVDVLLSTAQSQTRASLIALAKLL
ncbi:MAG TPA: S41 family peptidase [Candidatus Baltobacteraceae bacterium]